MEPFLHHFIEEGRQLILYVRMFQGIVNVGLDEIQLVTNVVALPIDPGPEHWTALSHGAHGIGQLNLVVLPPGFYGRLPLFLYTPCHRNSGIDLGV